MSKLVALTGGIGTGKSTVAGMLEKLGATIVDADRIVHELQAPGSPVLDEIVDAFGPEILDASGALDRDALGAIVFADEEARLRLNAIVHPKVGAEMARRVAAAQEAGVPLIVLDIPLLFESRRAGRGGGALWEFEATILAWTPTAVQIERTVARDGCTREDAERRVAAQMPIDEKRELAGHVIDNTGSLEQTEVSVRALYDELTGEEAAAAT